MKCPRCKSERLQRGFHDAALPLRLAGLREVLCNNCGYEFKGFDPLGRLVREKADRKRGEAVRRRGPRYSVRLPASITLVEVNPRNKRVWHSQAVRGHCTSISRFGLEVSFSGTRFGEDELAKSRRLMHVTVTLPKGAVSALVRTVTHQRTGGRGEAARWVVGAEFKEMSDADRTRLNEYLTLRAGADEMLF